MGIVFFVLNFIILSILLEVYFKKEDFVANNSDRVFGYCVITLFSAFGVATTYLIGFAAFVWCCIKLAQAVASKVVK